MSELSEHSSGTVGEDLDALLKARPGLRVADEAHALSASETVAQAFLAGQVALAPDAAAAARASVDGRQAIAAAKQRAAASRRERLLGVGGDGLSDPRDLARPLIEVALRAQRAQELRDWHTEAQSALDRLPAVDGQGPARDVRARDLLEAMRVNAVTLAMVEGLRRDWTAARDAASAAIELEDRTSLAVLGESIGPTPKPHLHAAYARFREEGLTSGLREQIDAARERIPDSPALAYWSAVYHLMAGDPSSAAAAVQDHRNDRLVRRDVLPLLEPLAAPTPDQGHPENFYSYLQNFADDASLHVLGDELDAYADLAAKPVAQWPADLTVDDHALDSAAGTVGGDVAQADSDFWADASASDASIASDPAAIRAAVRARRAANFARARATQSRVNAASYLRTNQAEVDRIRTLIDVGNRAVGCLQAWNEAARELRSGQQATCRLRLQELQIKLTGYFAARYPNQCTPAPNAAAAWSELVGVGRYIAANVPDIKTLLSQRAAATSLDQLYDLDWNQPLVSSNGYEPYASAKEMLNALLNNDAKIREKVDMPLLVIGLVMSSFGIAECARRDRDFSTAVQTYRQLLRLQQPSDIAPLALLIEVPMARIGLSQTLHDRGDASYKAGQRDDAAATFQEIMTVWADSGQYVPRVEAGTQEFATHAGELLSRRQHPLATGATQQASPEEQVALARLGRDVPVQTISVGDREAAGADSALPPHAPLLSWQLDSGSNEANPLIYAQLTRAQARLLQLRAGLNYLGYADGFAPVERFSVLLDRARAFAQNAKNAERDYLNFLEKAEDEQYREIGVEQSVALEKSSVAVEDGRVEQARLSATASEAGVQLAQRTHDDAVQRVENYQTFEGQMEDAENLQMAGAVLSGIGGAISSAADPVGAVGGIVSAAGSIASTAAQQSMAHAQRALEQSNLLLAIGEAEASLDVAQAQSAASQQGVIVASLEHATALLRHDFAVQNLDYLRSGRTLNADMWFRLAEVMREISETALRRAIEVAFLAQQAFAFEADTDINVIRFDYDSSPVGAFLAGDFLLRDLDVLEQTQTESLLVRRQAARLVVSLARDAPAALDELRAEGQAVVPISLRDLERRLPGLHNLRVGTVDLQPIALMDPLRLSVGLTHMGVSQIRRHAGTIRADEAVIGGWLPQLAERWPVAVHVSPPQTAIFTGLSRADAAAAAATETQAQRDIFDGLGAASAWHLDLSLKENGIVDGSLADVLITFVLTGAHDATLAQEVNAGDDAPDVRSQYLAATEQFPDAFYEFQQSGTLACPVSAALVGARPGGARLRNVGFSVVPAVDASDFTAVTSRIVARFQVTASGEVSWLDAIPQLSLSLNGPALHAELADAGATVSWDFGDGTTAQGASADHSYAAPGQYRLAIRATSAAGALQTWTADVATSPAGAGVPSLTAHPQLTGTLSASPGLVDVAATLAQADDGTSATWRLDGFPAAHGATASWQLEPGLYRLETIALRSLLAAAFCNQRHAPDARFPTVGTAITTNRVFDSLGREQMPADRNGLAAQMFGAGEIEAADTWQLELSSASNPCLAAVNRDANPTVALQAIGDVVLVLEHDDGPLLADESEPPTTYGWEFLGFTAYADATKQQTVTLDGLAPGDTAWVVVRAANRGTATWTPATVSLAAGNGGPTAPLSEATVAAGEVGTFELAFTAPHATGSLVETLDLHTAEPSLGGGQLTIPFTMRTGLLGSYYVGSDFSELVLTRNDPTVDFDWDNGGPDEVGQEYYSVRWTGRLHPPSTGSYALVTYSDDGVRLRLDGQLIIDDWNVHGVTRNPSQPQTLDAARAYDISLEYFQGYGGAAVRLCWIPPGGQEETIPAAHLDPGANG